MVIVAAAAAALVGAALPATAVAARDSSPLSGVVTANGSPLRDATLRHLVLRFWGDGRAFGGPGNLAFDSQGRVWANANATVSPTGHVGDEISPTRTGYSFDGLQRNTGVQVDASGNVRLANDWKTVPTPADPYGDGLAVILGATAPIAIPLVGTPKQP